MTDDLKETEFRLCPHELTKSLMRQRLYTMPKEEFERVKQDMRELAKDIIKELQRKGEAVCETAAQQFADRVKEGRLSINKVKEIVARISSDFDCSLLIRALHQHFPDETFEMVPQKTTFPARYKNEAIKAYERLQARHADLRWKIDSDEATYKDRLEELLVAAELEAAEQNWQGSDPAKKRLRQAEIEGIMWALEKLVRPTAGLPNGQATTSMPKRGAFDAPVTGIAPLLECLGF